MPDFRLIDPSVKRALKAALVLSVLLVAGCASKERLLMPTPALYQQEPGASALFWLRSVQGG